MATKIRTLVIGLSLFLLLTSSKAQEKYEYATIDYYISDRTIVVSKSTGEYDQIVVDKNMIKNALTDYRPALNKVVELESKGWELFQATPFSLGKVFYMRRKKN